MYNFRSPARVPSTWQQLANKGTVQTTSYYIADIMGVLGEDGPKLSERVGYIAFIRAANIASFLAAFFLISANLWICVQLSNSVDSVTAAMQYVVRIYNILFGLIVILSMFDLSFLATNAYFLLTYFGSGLFQMFVGILTLGTASNYRIVSKAMGDGYSSVLDTVRMASGWLLVCVGLVYILMGLLRFPHLKKRERFLQLSKNTLPSEGHLAVEV